MVLDWFIMKKKEYDKAIEMHKKALSIYKNINDKFYQTMCLNNMGKTYLAMKKYRLAEKYLTETYKSATEIGSKRFALDASMELAQLYHDIGNNDFSYNFSIKALAYKDSVTKELQKQNTQTISILYQTEKQKREIIILKQKAQLSELKLSRQRNALIAFVFVIMFLIMFGVWFIHQRKLKSKLKEIDLEQKLLQARLNPHFIFNSLAAIQNFILQNDKKAASEYIVNFSRLMRNILMGTSTDFILLENELEILDDYLKLQQLRFQNKFDYFFEISDDIDPQSCAVSPMLVQPFVENSIEHGIRDIDKQGVILIRFIKNGEYLVIEVEDNGRGLSDQQETEKKKGHISMATKITNQRMQNIRAVTKKQCNFEVLDISSLRNDSGVLVRIKIPYNEE
jgi:LytS/YehU family sensor histidine kinase